MPGLDVDVAVTSGLWERLPDAEVIVVRAIEATLAEPGLVLPRTEACEVTVGLADDATLRDLNRTYRTKDKPTNVLSFPADRGPLIGDVVIAFETLVREAEADRIPVNAHLAHLTVHGLLHLMGHDHLTEADALRMEEHETAILARLGFADPHACGRVMPDESDA